MNNNEEQKLSFEKALASLETVIHQLESGEITLEQSLQLFEEGVKLARICTNQLEDFEGQVQLLLEKDGRFLRQPFEPEGE